MALDVYSILRKRYPIGEYALLAEVRDAAGHNASRSADFVSVALWPSRGCSMHGIELKSYRSDWLSELKKPEKAEAIFQYCDYFWLLTTSDIIAKREEIPETWGWLNIEKDKIKVLKEAPKLIPKPVSKTFLAALLKRASDKTNYIHNSQIENRVKEEIERAVIQANSRNAQLLKDYNQLVKDVDEFKKASGIDLFHFARWKTNPTKIGEAVKILEDGGVDSIQKNLLNLEKTAADILNKITNAVAVFKDLEIIEKTEL